MYLIVSKVPKHIFSPNTFTPFTQNHLDLFIFMFPICNKYPHFTANFVEIDMKECSN